jgi:hypothetical protein
MFVQICLPEVDNAQKNWQQRLPEQFALGLIIVYIDHILREHNLLEILINRKSENGTLLTVHNL